MHKIVFLLKNTLEKIFRLEKQIISRKKLFNAQMKINTILLITIQNIYDI
jgi:hypothetical protein